MRYAKAFLFIVLTTFAAITVVFNFFPRSTFSALEKRELARVPSFSWETLKGGEFTRDLSAWFSDSEPFRDEFMTLSMTLKGLQAVHLGEGEEQVTFHASDDTEETAESGEKESEEFGEYEDHVTADEYAKIANSGILIVGSGENVRALMAYGGSPTGCEGYARAANLYKQTFGKSVNVYCMVIPTAIEYYCPDKAKKATRSQLATIKHVYSLLDPEVKPVDVHTTLGRHAAEPIYLRTDHHWAALGAYYAAEAFAKAAGVPFMPLERYERCVVKRFVGSMYGYSKDIAVKNAPEDFVYYKPTGVNYTTTYTDYTIDENYRVVAERKPQKGPFFYHYRDGNGGAYCTFMGSDTRITCVRTDTKSKRRVLILKDSFGNALPAFLFGSFSEIHVIDSRYFTHNMKDYVREHGITDILFANNIFKAYSSGTYAAYVRFLNQSRIHLPEKAPEKPSAADSVRLEIASVDKAKKDSFAAPAKRILTAEEKKDSVK